MVFPLLWLRLGIWHSADTKIPLENVSVLELRVCERERWAHTPILLPRHPKPASAARTGET